MGHWYSTLKEANRALKERQGPHGNDCIAVFKHKGTRKRPYSGGTRMEGLNPG